MLTKLQPLPEVVPASLPADESSGSGRLWDYGDLQRFLVLPTKDAARKLVAADVDLGRCAIRIGRRVRFKPEAVKAWVNRQSA